MKKFLLIFLSLVVVFSVCACTQQDYIDDNPPEPIEPTEMEKVDMRDNISKNDFSAYILDNAYDGKNTMFSPLSLDMAIAMVAEGAGFEYEQLFEDFFKKEDYAAFAEQYIEYLKELNLESDSEYNKYKTVFEIANSLWYQQNYTLNDTFIKGIEKFDAKTTALDFSDAQKTVDLVNDWCAEKTHDMIQEIINKENIKEDTKAIAVNAVYFEAPWVSKWHVESEKSLFTNVDNSEVNLNFMTTDTNTYYENEKATAFGCQYMNGLTFIGILPKEDGKFEVQDLDIDSLLENKTTEYDVVVKMPSFKFENKITNLKEILVNSGFEKFFDATDGVFTEMMLEDGTKIPMTISDIIQADAIELDENGTKAAAVTALMMDTCSAMIEMPEIKEVTLDRPFAFVIYDSEMDQIVFIGKVVDLS